MDYLTILTWAGRILFGGFFVMMGMMHFMKASMMADMASAKNVPFPKFNVLASGILLLAGGLSVVFSQFIVWGLSALVVFLVPTAFVMHNFWAENSEMKMMQMSNFMRNMALAGAAFLLLSFYL
ncbi:MAG: DoxX family protein [Candidatus Spechtbacterales bacterium]